MQDARGTALIVLEIDWRKMKISEIGWQAPADDALANGQWASMGPNTTSHVSGKVRLEAVAYQELRQAFMACANLITSSGKGNRFTAMDIGSIESVLSENEGTEQQGPGTLWSLDESGCPVDESGWAIEGECDEILNFVKGGGRETRGNAAFCMRAPGKS